MANPTTDEMYNAASREIQMKYEIYFTSDPLVVTRDDYLASSTGLEEAQDESSDVLGKVSSNEITLDLFNDNRIFTPNNTASPYFGRIRKGLKIVAYGRVREDTIWDKLGTYYVTEWSTSSSGLMASVTANDRLYSIFDAPMPIYNVTKDVAVKDLYKGFFDALGVSAMIDDNLSDVLLYGYINDTNKSFLTDLTNGALALCYGNREDGVSVVSRLDNLPLRATITDNDQIISIKTTQSLDTGYDGVSVTRNTKQESKLTELVSLKEQEVDAGVSILRNTKAQKEPIVRLSVAEVIGVDNVRVTAMSATPNVIDMTIDNNALTPVKVDIAILGKYLENVQSIDSDEGSNLLSLNSNYVQTKEQSDKVKSYLKRVVHSQLPTLSVDVRGNFKLKLGDKIHVVSEKYKVDYTGIIIRSTYSYAGNLSGTLTLVDASLFEGVQ